MRLRAVIKTPRRIWNTNLARDSYDASIDRTQYR